MIEICNFQLIKPCRPYDFYIDRRTVLGNPFQITNLKNRNEICDEFDNWFKEIIKEDGWKETEMYLLLKKMIRKYEKEKRLRLFCWCSPERCHGETYKNYIESGG